MHSLRILVLTALAFAVNFVRAAEAPAVPTEFSADMGGLLSGFYKVELKKGVLLYTSSGPQKSERLTIQPTAEQWREFRQALDDLKVWQWPATLPDGKVEDGKEWSLRIAFVDQKLDAKGSNNYPDAEGKASGHPVPTEAFKRYLTAVEKLLSGRQFR